jgi:hypothetical protein
VKCLILSNVDVFIQQVLGKSDTALVQKINKALPRLPSVTIAKDKTIMEWVNAQAFLWLDLFLF